MVDTSLYFHIPFCKKKCDYCHFYVVPDKESYKHILMDGFFLEWKRYASLLENKNLVSIYFGGGTPALLGPSNIQKILSWIPHKNIEITLEANPENITYQQMLEYREAGINRISVGIQSLDNHELSTLSRQHDANKAIQAVLDTKKSGIDNISIDLMYDLPGQTLHSWKHTLEQAVNLPITHLSLYNLTIEPHTVFYKYRNQISKQQPPEEKSAKMYQAAIETFNKNGLEQYEISAFARNDQISLHNTGYWTGRPFLGLGPSAFSYWDGKRFRNISHLHKWQRLLSEEHSPIDYTEDLDRKAKVRELLAIHLRLLKGVELNHFKLEEETKNTLSKLVTNGFLSQNGARLQLTEKGIFFYDSVASDII